jgi:hypothetical protein
MTLLTHFVAGSLSLGILTGHHPNVKCRDGTMHTDIVADLICPWWVVVEA